MSFAGIRDFRTSDPQLREDLRRLNVLLEQAFKDIEREHAERWTIRRTNRATSIQIGEMLLVDYTTASPAAPLVIKLPPSAPDSAGRAVRIVRAATPPASGPYGTLGDVHIVSPQGQYISDGWNFAYLPVGLGWVEYVDDGQGIWWRQQL